MAPPRPLTCLIQKPRPPHRPRPPRWALCPASFTSLLAGCRQQSALPSFPCSLRARRPPPAPIPGHPCRRFSPRAACAAAIVSDQTAIPALTGDGTPASGSARLFPDPLGCFRIGSAGAPRVGGVVWSREAEGIRVDAEPGSRLSCGRVEPPPRSRAP